MTPYYTGYDIQISLILAPQASTVYSLEIVSSEVDIRYFAVVEFDLVHEVVFGVSGD
jgi:hypothetical protein